MQEVEILAIAMSNQLWPSGSMDSCTSLWLLLKGVFYIKWVQSTSKTHELFYPWVPGITWVLKTRILLTRLMRAYAISIVSRYFQDLSSVQVQVLVRKILRILPYSTAGPNFEGYGFQPLSIISSDLSTLTFLEELLIIQYYNNSQSFLLCSMHQSH